MFEFMGRWVATRLSKYSGRFRYWYWVRLRGADDRENIQSRHLHSLSEEYERQEARKTSDRQRFVNSLYRTFGYYAEWFQYDEWPIGE